MSNIRIGFLDRSNNAAMLEILKSAPITTDNITLCFDRQPDIFLLPEIKYEKYYYLGYFVNETLSGIILNGYYKALVNGEPQTVFHASDYYILPEARGKGFSFRISDYLFKETYNNAKLGYLIIMDGNEKALSLIGRRHPRFPNMPWTRKINKLEVRTIMITWPLRLNRQYKIRNAEKKDIPEIVSLLNEEHRDRLFGLIYSVSTFESYVTSRTGMTLENYYVAEDNNGEICGVCGAWDCTSFKQNRVLNYGPGFLPAKIAYNVLSVIFGYSPLPAKGDFFRDINITDYAVKDRDPGIMNALLRTVYAYCRKEGYQSIIWGSIYGDPLLKATKGFFSQAVISNIVLLSTKPELIEENAIKNNLPYIDVACL
jgi:hypothetical protein